jgi:hypothetical protein
VDEVDVDAVNGRLELREGVQFCLALAPVIIHRPMADEFLEFCELRALRLIGDGLLVGPSGRHEAPLQVGEVRVRYVNAEGDDRIASRCFLRLRSADDAGQLKTKRVRGRCGGKNLSPGRRRRTGRRSIP